ncbi:hypothetical protein DL769_003065 [Monosporascus sp. CRB-8-3]|nr:hypothetical protein DL769_003065 [Monosporascus sp. CRB-8-3]
MSPDSAPRPNFHICVIGGGVVGLAGGILFRSQGLRVTILERDAALHTLHPNAVRVLQDIGVYDKVRSRSVVPLSIILKAYKTGEVLHVQDLLEPADRYGAPLLTLHRAHLRQLLYDEAIAQGVTVRHGVSVDPAGIDLTNGVLHLSNPDETFHADLFVGADGGHSVVREALTGRKPRAIPHGKVVNRLLIDERAISARPHLRYLVEQPNIVVWLGPECQAVTYGLDGTYNVAFTWPWSSDPEDVFFGPQPVNLADFWAELGAWDPDLRELVSLGTSCARWMFFEPEIDGDETPWVDAAGRFCLVGDAAHRGLPYLLLENCLFYCLSPPFTAVCLNHNVWLIIDAFSPVFSSRGQGAATGIESVSVLAHLLGKAVAEYDDGDDGRRRVMVGDALDIYQRLRKERTAHVTRATLKTGRLWQMPDGPLKDERDRELLRETGNPSVGYPNPLADPFFQRWLWGFDAPEAADRAWAAYRRGDVAGRGQLGS